MIPVEPRCCLRCFQEAPRGETFIELRVVDVDVGRVGLSPTGTEWICRPCLTMFRAYRESHLATEGWT